MIGAIARALGIDSLIIYAVLALVIGGGFLWWSAHKYNEGYSAGSAKERTAWVAQREEDQAKQLAKAAADQRAINQLEADFLAIQGRLAETQSALEGSIHAEGADKKPAMSKGVAKALNGVGR
ncbi:MAG: hypothetical protein EKK31_11570 [Hyphomicrobiales bacterium]|nr:MAG: hypothetical protein EKK31_11570 [Hyphomicrobiales bacterium]